MLQQSTASCCENKYLLWGNVSFYELPWGQRNATIQQTVHFLPVTKMTSNIPPPATFSVTSLTSTSFTQQESIELYKIHSKHFLFTAINQRKRRRTFGIVAAFRDMTQPLSGLWCCTYWQQNKVGERMSKMVIKVEINAWCDIWRLSLSRKMLMSQSLKWAWSEWQQDGSHRQRHTSLIFTSY